MEDGFWPSESLVVESDHHRLTSGPADDKIPRPVVVTTSPFERRMPLHVAFWLALCGDAFRLVLLGERQVDWSRVGR
jgi:hypothetical protein